MQTLNTFQSINERDIDLLILEELNVSESFARWISCRVNDETAPIKTVGAWHSVVDSVLGESDLVFIYQNDDLSNQAILFENKIDAGAQPAQGERYRLRGTKGVEEGLWQDFKTCLLAPKAYIEKNSESYDAFVAYEELMAFFLSKGEKRSAYRAQIIKDAITKQRRGYCATICHKTTEFARKYLSYVARRLPDLNPEPSKPRAAGHNWIHFYPNPANKHVRIIHQIYGKAVKLQFVGQAEQFDQIKNRFGALEEAGYRIIKSGKSVNIECKAPEINIQQRAFEDVKSDIDCVLERVRELHAVVLDSVSEKVLSE